MMNLKNVASSKEKTFNYAGISEAECLREDIRNLNSRIDELEDHYATREAIVRRDLYRFALLGFISLGIVSEEELDLKDDETIESEMKKHGITDLRKEKISEMDALFNFVKSQPAITDINGVKTKTVTAKEIRNHFHDTNRMQTHRRISRICDIYGPEIMTKAKTKRKETLLILTERI